jgi:hypothetical protein
MTQLIFIIAWGVTLFLTAFTVAAIFESTLYPWMKVLTLLSLLFVIFAPRYYIIKKSK